MPITTIYPQEGLNLDNDYSSFKNGEFSDGVDVKIKSDGTSNGYILQNIEGNEYKFTIPDVVAQNKKWLLQQGTDGTAYTLTLYDAYNNVLATATNTVYATLITAFDTALTTATITFTRVHGTFNGKAEDSYEFTSIPFYDYKLVNTGNPLDYIYLVQEAIDDGQANTSYTAMKRVLNSCKGTDGVYVFTTNVAIQSAERVANVLAAAVTNNGGKVKISSVNNIPYGLTAGQHFQVLITNSSNPTYNGIHIATTGATGSDYTLMDVAWVSATNLTATTYISTYGELGFVPYSLPIGEEYQKIFSTTQWDFTVLNPMDSRSEPYPLGYDVVYWASLQEYIRRFSVYTSKVPLYNDVTFAAIPIPKYHVLRGGFYDYETINTESLLQLPNISTIQWISQSLSGGAIKAGNWRYFNSFIASDSSSETELGNLTNIVEVYLNNTENNYAYVLGNTGSTITSKVNNLQITGFPQGVYKYAVLYGAHYAEGAVNIYRIKQQLITDETVINISHYGTETYELMSFSELRFANLLYKAQNIAINDNRLIPSNLILEGSPDLTDFTDTITYNIQKELVTEVGEYKNPTNANNQVGCMVNEGYVYGVQYELKDGTVTDQVYPIKEVIIINGDNTPAGKRVAGGITDVSLTDSVTGKPYVFYPNFIINWDTALVNGKPARDVIKTVKIWRAEVINPRVIACGLMIPTVYSDNPGVLHTIFRYSGDAGLSVNTQIFAYPEVAGDVFFAADNPFPDAPNYASDYNVGGSGNQHMAFYAPDYFYTGNQFSFETGDQIIYDTLAGDSTAAVFYNTTPPKSTPSAFKQFFNSTTSYATLDVSAVTFCPTGGTANIGAATFNNLLYQSNKTDVTDHQWNCWQCHVLQVDTGADLGINYATVAYYIRPRADQYGDYSMLKFAYTNVLQNEADVPLVTTVPIPVNNGGDTFTQFTPLKQRVKTSSDLADAWAANGIVFYSQNRINSQMRVQVGTQNLYLVNSNEVWLCNVEPEAFNYNAGYSIYGNDYIKTLTAFDPNVATITSYGSRMIYSAEKPAGSLVDDYRIIPPLNFYDFPIVNGTITDIKEINRQLIVLQPLKISHKYFNSEGAFTTVTGDNIVLGDNAVASRREMDFSSFGSRHKQSVQVGKTESGRDVVYWVCSDYKKIMRWSDQDGTVCLSDRAKIKSWCEANIIDAFNYTTAQCIASGNLPIAGLNSIAGLGICGVWNQKDKEYVITFRRTSDNDSSTITAYTISFCEVTNRFVSFYKAWPTVYIPFRDAYLTPDSRHYNYFPTSGTNPVSSDTGDIYLHNDDVVDNTFKPTYYGTSDASVVSVIVNADVINNKLWQNFEADYEGGTPATYGAFIDVQFVTKTQTGAIGDSELALDFLRGQVGLDSSFYNLNGVWLKTTFTFDITAIAKLIRYTVKFMQSNRLAQR